MTPILQLLKTLGPVRVSALALVGLGLIGFFIYLMTRLSSPDLVPLYSDLQRNDAAAMVAKLEEMQVPFDVTPDGSQILVPANQVGRLRMALAQDGLPSGGSIGNEIFDQPEGFGTTSFIQNINQQRALEGELARTIASLEPIQQARVHLVMPRRELFSRERQTASASIILKLRPGAQLNREQIAAIQHLAAAAVPQLDPTQISIIDDRGNLLARGMDRDSPDYLMQTAEEKRLAFERRMTQTIEDLLGRTLGYGRVRAQVTAELDFDRISTNSEIYDPESQVVRSTQTVEETSESTERDPLDPVTVANNLPAAQANDALSAPSANSRTSRVEETVNYEITRTVRSHVRETGQVRRLSVAVLVDGTYRTDETGAQIYQPRSPEEMEQIAALVRSAIGYDALRGDTVEVVNMRFATAEDTFADDPMETILGLPREDILRIVETIVLAIVAVLVILLVVRPLIARAFEVAQPGSDHEADALLTDQSAAQPQLTGPGALSQDLALEEAAASEELEQMIDINRVEGRVRASSLRKVGEIVDKHPEEAVAIIRNWLYQET